MTGATLPQENLAALAVLAASPLAREAVERAESARTDRRRAVIEAHQRDEAESLRLAEQAGAELAPARAEAARLRELLRAADGRVRQAEFAEMLAADRVERVRNRVAAELAELGGDRIEFALRRVFISIREAQAAIDYRQRRDDYGTVVAVHQVNDEAPRRLEYLQGLAAELQGMRLSTVEPRTIDERCAEIQKWIDGGTPVPRTVASRAAGLQLFERAFGKGRGCRP